MRRWCVRTALLSILAVATMLGGLFYTYWKKAQLTYTLLIVNIFVFLLELLSPDEVISDLAFSPGYLFRGERLYTIFTSMYLHTSILHIMFNMIFLALIGLPLEEKIGTLRFGLIYFLGGLAAGLTYSFTSGLLHPSVIAMGASGGLSAVLGAYARLYPNERFSFFVVRWPTFTIYQWAFLFLVIDIVGTFVPLNICLLGNVAHLAHVGGLFAGLIIAPYIMRIETKEGEKKLRPIDFQALESLAKTEEDKALIEKIKSEDEPEVRKVWLEHFISKAQCPQCGNRLTRKGRTLSCSCGNEIRF